MDRVLHYVQNDLDATVSVTAMPLLVLSPTSKVKSIVFKHRSLSDTLRLERVREYLMAQSRNHLSIH
ncbi:hypothetical protein [Roseivirga pacifica]|uniref:hypothetical protein n=1 Tax=Roseivirga pacifica TaxID=1267423 RepID=UPI00227C52C9|nr:hypothetical protein [Roseivirga pacifica]